MGVKNFVWLALIALGSGKAQQSTFKCRDVGFYADPADCRNFYRCYIPPQHNCAGICRTEIRALKEEYFPYSQAKFTCGEGTIFDEKRATCNHPANVDPSQNCMHATVSNNQNQNADAGSVPYPEEIYHECFGVDNFQRVHCIKDQGILDDGILVANSGKTGSISFSVVEVAYRCGSPKDIIGRTPLGFHILEAGQSTGFVSAGVSNGFCRKHVFYNCRVNGIDQRCLDPPFYIQFKYERPPLFRV